MNDIEQDNRNAPSYLAHYGMHRPPFADKVEDDMYYAEPTRTQRLDMLMHLTQYSHEILLVTGPEGIGKTTMLHQFVNKAPGSWKLCSVNAHPMMDQEQLMYRICHSLNLTVDSPDYSTAVANLKRRLDELLTATPTVVIVIDNAHILATGALSLLVDLSKIRNSKSGTNVRVVLFCEPQIKIQFASTELEPKQKNAYRKIDLPPFSEEHTGKLIHHRVQVAGLQANHTFTPTAISKIFKQSRGIPGDIVELAHRVLFEMTPLKRRSKIKTRSQPAPATEKKAASPVGLAVAMVAVVAIALLLAFQKEINQVYSGKTAGENATARVQQSLPLPRNMPKAGQSREQIAQDAAEDPVEPQEEEFVTPSPRADKPTPRTTTRENTQAIQTSGAKANRAEATPVAADGGEPLVININQSAWLMEQNPNYYTLQLLAGYKKSTINNFLRQHKLPATELAYYYSLNKGKGWHSLVFGVYPDYGSAQTAIKSLPAGLRKTKPWIRRIRSIQKEIKQAAKAGAN